MTSYVRAPLNFMAHQRATVGDQKISFTNFDHLGWLKCDGRAVSRTTYALLFNVIGTTFGVGDGSTTFNLPNYKGCVPGMPGEPPNYDISGANPTIYTRGQLVTGEQRHLLTVAEMPTHNHGTQTATGEPSTNYELTSTNGDHTHSITDPGHTHTLQQSLTALVGTGPEDDWTQGSGTNTGSSTTGITINSNGNHTHTLSSQGGSQYHNNMQPTLFGGNMYIFSGRMYSGLGTYPFTSGTDLA